MLPQVADIDAYWLTKQRALGHQTSLVQEREYKPIEVPNNSAAGFSTAFFAVITGFALIWHIWWMAGIGALGIFLTMLVFAFREEEEIKIPAEQIAAFDRVHPAEVAV